MNNNIPKHWKILTLGEVAFYVNGRAFKPTEWKTSGKPIIRIQNLNKEEADYNYSNEDFEAKYKVVKGDLLYAWSASLGVYIWNGDDAWLNQHIFKVIPKEIADKKYLFYLLKKITLELLSKSHGSGMVHVTKNIFESTKIPLPPLSEQQRIVAKIEELFSELDKGIESLKTAQQQLKVYRQAVLKYAFEGKFTEEWRRQQAATKQLKMAMAAEPVVEYTVRDLAALHLWNIPDNWKWTRATDIIDTINNGYTPTKDKLFERSGEVPFIKVYNLNFDGSLNFKKDPSFISKTTHEKELKRSICYPGDVLINIVGPPLGKVSIVPNTFPEWNINQAIVLFRPNQKILSKYIAFLVQNPVIINWLEDTSKATAGQWNVKVSTCRIIPIPVAPVDEQQQIVSEIERRLSVCDKIEESIAQGLKQAEALRQSILKRAFEGRLV